MKLAFGWSNVYLVLVLTSPSLQAGSWNGPDIMATQKEYIRDTAKTSSSGTIYMGKRGTYIRVADSMGTMIIASNNRKKVCWMANKKMKIYTQARMNVTTGSCDAMSAAWDGDSKNEYGSLMSDTPCQGYTHKRQLGSEKTGGRAAQKWKCMSASGHQSIQWYDPEYRLVIKSMEYDSTLELTGIKKKSMPKNILQVPEGYRKVSGEEFGRALMSDAMSNRFSQQQQDGVQPSEADEKAFLKSIQEFLPQ